MRGIISKIRAHVRYSIHEIVTIILTALVVGFVFSFARWGDGDVWDAFSGISNWIYFAALGLILIVVITWLQKAVASLQGLELSYSRSYTYLILPVVASFFTNGASLFFIPPGFIMDENLGSMLGRNRYRRGLSDFLQLGMVGTMVPTFLAILFSTQLFSAIAPEFGTLIFIFVLNSLLPYDFIFRAFDGGTGVSNGSAMFYKSRSIYIYSVIFLISAYLMIVSLNIVFTILFSFVLAMAFALFWLVTREM